MAKKAKPDNRPIRFPEDVEWPSIAIDLTDCPVCGGGWFLGDVAHIVDRGSSGDGHKAKDTDVFVHAVCMDEWLEKNQKHLKRKKGS